MHSQNKTCVPNGTLVNRTFLVYLQLNIAACYSLCILGSNVLSRSWNRFIFRFRTKGKEHCNLNEQCFLYKLLAIILTQFFVFITAAYSNGNETAHTLSE
jgi:hypothetical protein